ncbi:MAG: Cna domain protein, partial [Candidatus Solibacter sp.]|nr:Cna domain protein [Candidatus Solibacter sp.]
YNSATNQPVFIFQHFNPGTNVPIIVPSGTAYPIFPNATIPKSLISPIGQKLLNLQALPNMPINALGQNNSLFRHVRNTDNRYNIKVDQVISANNRLSVRFSQAPTKGVRFFQGGLAEQVPTDRSIGTNAALADTYTWGGNKVNEFRFGFNRSNIARTQTEQQLAFNGYKEFGFPSFLSFGMPQTALGDSQVQSISSSPGTLEYDNFYELSDTLSWTKGKHSLKIGFDIQAPQQNLIDYSNVGGNWGFNAAQTNVGTGSINTQPITGITSAQTGLGMASLLLGYPNSVSIAPAVVPYQYRWKYVAGFLQDDWKVTPRLTFNMGLRYQFEVPRSEKYNKQGTFIDQRITLPTGVQQNGYVQLDGQNGAPTTLWPTRWNNIEPRFGFAWRLPRLLPGLQVLRGAYAISHVPTNGLYSSAFPDLSPRASSLATTGAANGGQVQMDFAPLVLPTGGFVMPDKGIITNFNSLNAIYRLNRKVSIPYIQQWNLGLGFQFGKDYALDVNYVGSKGTNNFGTSTIFNAVNLDEYVKEYQAGLNMGQLVDDPTGLLTAAGTPVQVTRQNSLRTVPTLGDVTDPLSQGYGSRYNALQMNFTKRFSKGFQFGANYTWMKSMDDSSCAGQFCTGNIQNWGTGSPQLYGEDRKIDKSISVSDIPSTFRFNFNWDLPFGKGKPLLNTHNPVLNQIIGNWKTSGNGEIRSGFPLQALSGTTAGFPDAVRNIRVNVNSGVNPVIPNWKDNCNNSVTQRCPYINVMSIFTPPAYLSIGNAPRVIDYVRMPHITTFNMAILKDFPIHEKIRLAFRAELYGALNHVFFQTNANNFIAYTGLTYTGTLVKGVTVPTVTQNNVNTAYADVGANIGGNRTVQLGLKLYF